MKRLVWCLPVLVLPLPCWGGVWNGRVGGWSVVLARCWVLRNQAGFPPRIPGAPPLWGAVVRAVGGGVVVLEWSSRVLSPRVGGGGWVGLLFEICIVDASIFCSDLF